MEFREALKFVYQNRKTEGDITDPFYLYCRLSDLCKSSYQAKNMIELFFKIDKRVLIFGKILENKKESRDNLLSCYDMVKDLVEKKNYESLISLVCNIANNIQPNKAIQKVVKAHHNNQAPPNNKGNRNCKNQNNLQQNKVKQANNTFTSSKKNIIMTILVVILGIVGVALAVSCFVLLICGLTCKDWDNTLRQWLIGICGSLLLFVVYLMIKEWGALIDTLFLTAFVVFNIVMIFHLRGDYKIIFGCFYVFSLFVNLCCETDETYKKIVFLANTGFLIAGYIIS